MTILLETIKVSVSYKTLNKKKNNFRVYWSIMNLSLASHDNVIIHDIRIELTILQNIRFAAK